MFRSQDIIIQDKYIAHILGSQDLKGLSKSTLVFEELVLGVKRTKLRQQVCF